MKFQPAIKWTGSKRSQSFDIVATFPKKIKTYYEPFVGGASVLYALLQSDVEVEEYICSDINQDLINLWLSIMNNPNELVEGYRTHWLELNKDEDGERRKAYYHSIRDQFNKDKSTVDFLFINRNCINGLIRYNSKGEFNSSFHFSRKGIEPNTLLEIFTEWSSILNEKNVQFICRSYDEIKTNEGDLIYCDPPYAATKGMYYGGLDFDRFFLWLSEQQGQGILSFDGIRGENDFTYEVPSNIVKDHLYLDSGSSSFSRIKTKRNEMVKESLYIIKPLSERSD